MLPPFNDPFILASRGTLHEFKRSVATRPDYKILNGDRGDFLIHSAVKGGNYDVVEYLLMEGVPATQPGASGATPLHYATAKGDVDVLSLLIKYSEWVDPGNKNGMTPVHVAAGEGRVDVLKLLIGHGASIYDADRFGRTAFHYASGSNQKAVVELLASFDHVVLEQPDNFGMRPLHWASYFEASDVCIWLRTQGVKLNRHDIYGRQPGYFVRISGKPEIQSMAEWLPSDLPEYQLPSIHQSVLAGDTKRLQEITENGPGLHQRDRLGRTGLHMAAFMGNRETFGLLSEKGACANNIDDYGWAPIKLLSYRNIRKW